MSLRDTNLNPTGAERGTVAGLFSDYSKAEQAISDLKKAGFSDNQIGLARADDSDLSSGTSSSQNMGEHHDNRSVWDKIKGAFGAEEDYRENRNDAAFVGRDAAIDNRDISAVDPDSSLDRDDALDRDAALNSPYAYPEDFQNSLTGAGIPEDRARYFGSNIHRGGVLVTVNAFGGRAAEAIAILERNGADIGSGEVDFGSQRQPSETSRPGLVENAERRIQLLGEMLRVYKERVSRGEVRLRKEVVTENRSIEVPVVREELVIERVSTSNDQPVNAEIGSDQEIRVPLTEEQVKVEKQPVVTGEVRVGKKEVQGTRTVSDTVRHEEVKVDKEGEVEVDDRNLKPGDKKRRSA
jgi:uncharacterized protein (TIGR02271 family)